VSRNLVQYKKREDESAVAYPYSERVEAKKELTSGSKVVPESETVILKKR
jgi:hypothetical protein